MKTLTSQLLTLANADLRAAKRHGCTFVCNTKRGALRLAPEGTGFSLVSTDGTLRVSGPAKAIAATLAGLYSVEVSS